MKRIIFLLLCFQVAINGQAQILRTNGNYIAAAVAGGAPTFAAGDVAVEIIGQSNPVGKGPNDALNEVIVPAGVYEYKVSNGTIINLADPTGEGSSAAVNVSLLPAMGKRLHDLLPGKNIYFIKRPIGATSILDWKQGGYIDSYADPAWQAFVTYCAGHSITIGYKFIYWYQGEQDVLDMDADEYIYNLYNFKKYSLGLDAGFKKFIYARIGYDTTFTKNDSSYSRNIMKAQTIFNCLDTAKDAILSTNQIATYTNAANQKGTGANEVHLWTLGLNAVGVDAANAIYQYMAYGTKYTLPTEPVSQLAGLCSSVDTINRYTNLLLGPWDWEWLFNSNIYETSNKVSSRYRKTDNTIGNPTITSGNLVLDTSGFVVLGRPLVATGDFTIEWTSTMGGTTGIDYLTTLTGPSSQLTGGTNSRIYYEWKAGSGAYCYVEIATTGGGVGTGYKYWLISTDPSVGGAFNPTIEHTYKIVNNVGANTVELFIDTHTEGTGIALTGGFNVQIIGGGHPTKDYNFRGQINRVNMKNSL